MSIILLELTLTMSQIEIEFVNLISGRTNYPILLKGVGTSPNIDFAPNCKVFRLEAIKNRKTECNFEMHNRSASTIILTLEKLFEIEGTLHKANEVEQLNTQEKNKKLPKATKAIQKFSDVLSDDEYRSIEHFFRASEQAQNLISITEKSGEEAKAVLLPANSKTLLKINFGLHTENGFNKNKKSKKRSSAKTKKSVKSSSKESSHKSKIVQDAVFLSKYNIMFGTNFLKDIIVIGYFKSAK